MDLVILISLFVSWMRLMSISILTSSYMFISMCHKNTPSYNSSNTTGPQKRRRPGHGLQCELQALQAALRISGRWLLCEFRRWRRSPHGRCGWRGGTTSRAWPGVFRRVFMRNCLIRNSGWKKKMAFWCWCSFTYDFRRNSMSLRSLQALRNTQWMLQAQHEPERWVPSMLKWQSKPNSKANMQLVVLMFGDVSVVDGSALLVT